jgi:hypothetical protein
LVLFGSPWEKLDPNMQKTFEGPAAGVGQSYAWNGNKKVGKGKMTIEESVPGQKVGMKLEFVEPMESTATCALTLAGTLRHGGSRMAALIGGYLGATAATTRSHSGRPAAGT